MNVATTGRRASHPFALEPCEAVRVAVRRVVSVPDAVLDTILVALVAGGHVLIEGIPGCKGQAHITFPSGHFTQEEQGPLLCQIVLDFMKQNPLPS